MLTELIALCLAAAAALVAVQTTRRRRQLRRIPTLGKHWPILGRVKTLSVCRAAFFAMLEQARQHVSWKFAFKACLLTDGQ